VNWSRGTSSEETNGIECRNEFCGIPNRPRNLLTQKNSRSCIEDSVDAPKGIGSNTVIDELLIPWFSHSPEQTGEKQRRKMMVLRLRERMNRGQFHEKLIETSSWDMAQ
jgi:hypothetical protein